MSTHQIIVDRFEISDLEQDLLGQGGMGDVYRGTDTQTGEPVAIKALKLDVVAGNPDIVARFVREGEALRQLNHPNIVDMVAAVEERDREGVRHYLVTEYVGGGSLQDLLDTQGVLSVERVVEISLDIADALTRAHRLGIVHRDLKPANVLLAEDGTPRLTDFGVAYVADSPRLTQTGMLVGTLDYLSPEACQGEPQDGRADIWAFGVMLYEMLTGERPFTGETVAAVLTAILTQPVPDLAETCTEVPDALADLVYRMLEKDRQQRIPSVRLVGAELEAILAVVSGQPLAVSGQALLTESRFATPTPPTNAPRHNLPIQPTPFVGREAELSELDRLLANPDVRLLTILGVGGMGKTRLALEEAAAQVNNYAHGIFFCSLAPLQSVETIAPTVAEALGFSFYEGGTPRQQLLDYLRQKTMLLIMDNFEHLLDGVGLVTDVLETAPGVKILATSRVRLNVQGEHRFHIAGLDFPDWETPEDALEYSAVKLFMQGARRAQPGFELVTDDLKYVSRICRLVDGMPLAILLAAAWIEVLTPAEIAAEISQSLDFLETDLRDIPERQRSVHAVCNYSWNLLSRREQEVFQALSVFRGGFTRQAAQQVTGASLRELRVLVDRSLLHRAPNGRYEMHELLRQYAEEKLERLPDVERAVRDRHCAHYVAALEGWETDLKGPRQQIALAEVDAEIENVRAAWSWAVEQDHVERMDRAMEGLGLFLARRFRDQEGETAFREAAEGLVPALKQPPIEVHRVLAKALAWQSLFVRQSGRVELSCQMLERSLDLLERPELADRDTRPERAFVLFGMGWSTSGTDRERAGEFFERSLALYQALDDQWGIARVLRALSHGALVASDLERARQWTEESVAIYQALGDTYGMAETGWRLSHIHAFQGRAEQAERSAREYRAVVEGLGIPAGIGAALCNLGRVLCWIGKYADAQSALEEGVTLLDGLVEGRPILAHSSIMLGSAQMHLGRYKEARAQVRVDLDLAGESGLRYFAAVARLVLGRLSLVRGAYAEAQELMQGSVVYLREVGRRRELREALASLGYVARGRGDPGQAQRCLYECLQLGGKTGAITPILYGLPAVALLLADRGEVERAVELYALASRHAVVANSKWFEDVAGRHIAAAAAGLPPDVVAAAQERGRARDLWATVEELLAEL